MPDDKLYCIVQEFDAAMAAFQKKAVFPHGLEWAVAIKCGWDSVEFERHYSVYVESTQIKIGPEDDATKLKGVPLEMLARYFLEKGGLAKEIKEITAHSKWQIDGYGPVNRMAIQLCWGEEKCVQIGMQVYMEAKNHVDPVTNEEFSVHFRRMEEHQCNLGVIVSTSGYYIGKGQGIAESIYHNSAAKKFHILLTFQSMMQVVLEDKPPMAILGEVLVYALNNSYTHEKQVQKAYLAEACHRAAEKEYQRLFPSC
jgi:hypothetical protein